MEILHCSTIPCTRSKSGATNTANLSSKGSFINTANLYPYDDMSSYLYILRLTSHTNAFRFPNQITPGPNIQGVSLHPKRGTQSGSKLATHCPSSKGD